MMAGTTTKGESNGQGKFKTEAQVALLAAIVRMAHGQKLKDDWAISLGSTCIQIMTKTPGGALVQADMYSDDLQPMIIDKDTSKATPLK